MVNNEQPPDNVLPGYSRVAGSNRRQVPNFVRKGPVRSEEQVSVTIRVRRRPRRQGSRELPDLEHWHNRCKEKPERKRKSLSRKEFVASYGAAQSDIDRVVAFALSQGLVVESASLPRRNLILSGSAKQMNVAFGVDLGLFESPDGAYRGREGYIHVPSNLAGIIEGVFGLDNRQMAKRAASAGGLSLLTPPQVANLYSFPIGPSAAGQTIGLLQFGACGYRMGDVQKYFDAPGFTMPSITDVRVNGASNAPGINSDADAEVTADINVAGSVAQGAAITVYFSTWDEQGWVQAISTVIHPEPGQPKPSVLSISWVWPELTQPNTPGGFQWTSAAIKAVSETFQEAAALTENVTILASTGDWGSDCGVGDSSAHVCYPASDPWVTACGGTTIPSVSGLVPAEQTWNDDRGATGGGISSVFPVPAWQSNAGLPASVNPGQPSGRGIPDIAGYVGPYTVLLNGTYTPVSGTSVTAPLYAGLVALANASLKRRVGFLNPRLYNMAGSDVFRDITDGINNSFHTAPGYTSGPGWDACTGLGSVNGRSLLDALTKGFGS